MAEVTSNWWTFSWCFMMSRFILYTLSSTFRAYKKKRLPLAAWMRHNTFSTTILLSSCSRVSLSQSSARGVLGEQASRTTVCIVTPARVCGRSGFWGASLRLLASSWLLPTSSSFSDHLLLGGHSRDCTRNIILHRLWSATSSNTQCWLVWMEPPVP
jgi:hypothetical protein